MRAGDEACPTLQTTFVLHLDPVLPIQGIQVGRANVQAVANLALGLTDLLIDSDVGFCVNLEDIQAELGFNVHAILPKLSVPTADP
jgi:hypothetical protein